VRNSRSAVLKSRTLVRNGAQPFSVERREAASWYGKAVGPALAGCLTGDTDVPEEMGG
jgi:hypothetical protein